MSRLSDYSKFDHLDSDSDNENDDHKRNNEDDNNKDQETETATTTTTTPTTSSSSRRRKYPSGRMIELTSSSSPTNSGTSSAASSMSLMNNNNNANASTNTTTRFRFVLVGENHHGDLEDVGSGGVGVYDWEQTLREVIIYVNAPPFVSTAKQIHCIIQPNHLILGLKQQQQQHDTSSTKKNGRNNNENSYYLNHVTFGTVDVNESTWILTDDDNTNNGDTNGQRQGRTIEIYLHKTSKGLVWKSPFKDEQYDENDHDGNNNGDEGLSTSSSFSPSSSYLNPLQIQTVNRELLLERWQDENPGMDFRGASYSGSNVPDPRTFMGGVRYD